MAFKSSKDFWDFSNAVRLDFRYVHGASVQAFFNGLEETLQARVVDIDAGHIEFWRAREGSYENFEDDGHYRLYPLAQSEMLPRATLVSEGRINPKGIAYLYMATKKETAISEIRPWIGAQITVVKIITQRDIKLIDCSRHSGVTKIHLPDVEVDQEQINDEVWCHIDNAFSRPVSPNDKFSSYVPTQVIAEFFKSKEYDGIFYKSKFSDGHNVALFNVSLAKIIQTEIHEVSYINVSARQIG